MHYNNYFWTFEILIKLYISMTFVKIRQWRWYQLAMSFIIEKLMSVRFTVQQTAHWFLVLILPSACVEGHVTVSQRNTKDLTLPVSSAVFLWNTYNSTTCIFTIHSLIQVFIQQICAIHCSRLWKQRWTRQKWSLLLELLLREREEMFSLKRWF